MMYGSEWQPCRLCGVCTRPEEQTCEKEPVPGKPRVDGPPEVQAVPPVPGVYVCKDVTRCRRFQEEKSEQLRGPGSLEARLRFEEKRRGPVQPPPIPRTGAVSRRRAKRSTRRRPCPSKK